jgi:16S rRNA processing protein RimM
LKTTGRELLAVGRIEKAFGIKGEVVVDPMTDAPGRFRMLKRIFIGADDEEVQESLIEHVSVEPRGVRVKLKGVRTRRAAEQIVGLLLFVDETGRASLPKGRFFVHQLIGLAVVDQHGRTRGKLKEVMKLPAQDVYVVDMGGREIMLPAVKEFVTAIDMSGGTITVNLIEGMLEKE